MAINKSEGVTESERLLSKLCDETFLKLWSYPNPYKDDTQELCDLLVIFEDIAFIFFDREKYLKDTNDPDFMLSWERWQRRVIEAQIKTVRGAEKYLRSGRKIYLDNTLTQELPTKPTTSIRVVHKIIVAHGAADACLNSSTSNVYGSLAMSYTDSKSESDPFPFQINLGRTNPVHVFDTHNLPIMLKELDTIWDLNDYLQEKVVAINTFNSLIYCGEEDLLANYFLNYDEKNNRHFIGTLDRTVTSVAIGEGGWKDFVESPVYERTKLANKISYLWDNLIQQTCDHALAGSLIGESIISLGRSGIHEMAKEPRFSRRGLSEWMFRAINKFPENVEGLPRYISLMPSFYPKKRYLFLQLRAPSEIRNADDYRQKRQFMLEVACGAAKNAYPEIELIVGIAIDAPKFFEDNSEDFLLMDCLEWTEEERIYYENLNEKFGFFITDLQQKERTVTRFISTE
jgi:hypothetical protein